MYISNNVFRTYHISWRYKDNFNLCWSYSEFSHPNKHYQIKIILRYDSTAKFSPHLAKASEPLGDLLSTKNCWVWTEQHTKSSNNIKEILSTSPVLMHYDKHKPTKIRMDGSILNGIKVILLQKGDLLWKPNKYGSWYLT